MTSFRYKTFIMTSVINKPLTVFISVVLKIIENFDNYKLHSSFANEFLSFSSTGFAQRYECCWDNRQIRTSLVKVKIIISISLVAQHWNLIQFFLIFSYSTFLGTEAGTFKQPALRAVMVSTKVWIGSQINWKTPTVKHLHRL